MTFELFSADTEVHNFLLKFKIIHIYTLFSLKTQYLKPYKNDSKNEEKNLCVSLL